jgi:large subunit ribosomal protein L30
MATTKEETANKEGGNKIKIRLTAGLVGKMDTHRKVVRALGLKRFNSTVEHVDSPTIRGMVNKIRHLVTVEGETKGKSK